MSEIEHREYDIFVAEQKQINERFTKAFEGLVSSISQMSTDVKAMINEL